MTVTRNSLGKDLERQEYMIKNVLLELCISYVDYCGVGTMKWGSVSIALLPTIWITLDLSTPIFECKKIDSIKVEQTLKITWCIIFMCSVQYSTWTNMYTVPFLSIFNKWITSFKGTRIVSIVFIGYFRYLNDPVFIFSYIILGGE